MGVECRRVLRETSHCKGFKYATSQRRRSSASTSQGCKETLLGYVIEFHETLDEGCEDEVTLEPNDFRVGPKRAIVRDVEWFGAVEEDECVR